MRIRSTLLMLLVTGTMVAGCHKAPERPPEDQATQSPKPSTPTPVAIPTPKPVHKPKTVAARVKAAPEPSADQQMLDDADATGMTSHASSDGDTSNAAGNDQQ